MHIDQLTYFVHVVETGSINATAQKYFMTQQAINASLKKLENEVGSPLLVRNYKGIKLTPQGHIFLYYAKNILQQHIAIYFVRKTAEMLIYLSLGHILRYNKICHESISV